MTYTLTGSSFISLLHLHLKVACDPRGLLCYGNILHDSKNVIVVIVCYSLYLVVLAKESTDGRRYLVVMLNDCFFIAFLFLENNYDISNTLTI